MFEGQSSRFKKYQSIAGILGFIGFVLGTVISGVGIVFRFWICPFGDGILHSIGFSFLIGLGCGFVLGNLVAILLVGYVKISRNYRKTRRD